MKAAKQLRIVNLKAGFNPAFSLGAGVGAHQEGVCVRRLKKSEGDGAGAQQVGGAQRKVAGELGQMQDVIQLEGECDQGLGAAAMLLGLVEVSGQFESDGNLRGQGAGAADVLIADGPGFDAVEDAKHAEHVAVRTEQGDGEELADLKSGDEIQVSAGSIGGVIGDEDIFFLQGLGSGAVIERDIDRAGDSVLDSPADVEGGVFEESDEAAFEAKEAGGAEDGGLHELIEFSGGTEFEGNLEDFVEFMGLGAGHAVQLGVGDGDRAKSRQGRNQGFVFLSEGVAEAGIDQNGALGAGGAKGRGDENSRGRIVSEMRGAVDAYGDALAGGDGAGGDFEGGAEVVVLETRTDLKG